MRFLKKNLPCLLCILLYLLCILAANPQGEFPLNDDWSYARSAFAVASGQGLKVDEWSAPSLVGQALYGGLLAKLFSTHFLVLRLSTLLLSCGTVCLLWGICRRFGFEKGLAIILLLAWIFNPLQFNLSFTFMTEVPFLFFAALGIYLYLLHRETGRPWFLMLSAAALGYAFLIRQTALFFILALICAVFLDSKINLKRRIRQCLLVAVTAGCFIATYYLWVMTRGGSTAAVNRKFELLDSLTSKQIIGNAYGMLFYLSFMLLPLWLFLIPSLYRAARSFGFRIRIGLLGAWAVLVGAGLWWYPANYLHSQYMPSTAYHARMPFLLNVLYDTGLGPITLDPEYFGSPPTPIYPGAWVVVTAIVAVGAICCGLLCTLGVIRLRRQQWLQEHKPVFVFIALSSLFIVVFEIIFSHLQEGGLFDRHILIVAMPFALMLGLLGGRNADGQNQSKARLGALVLAGAAIAALCVFCVTATHDYLQWNRVRWQMGRDLIAQGVDPLTIAGGFEFNAWYNYDTFKARGNIAGVHYWWFDKRDYLISMSPMDGYEVLQRKEYFSWVHRRLVALYIIRDSKLIFRRGFPDIF